MSSYFFKPFHLVLTEAEIKTTNRQIIKCHIIDFTEDKQKVFPADNACKKPDRESIPIRL